MRRKLLGLFTVLCMLTALVVPVSVSAASAGDTFTAGDFTYTVLTDTSTVKLTSIAAASLSGAVTIPSTVSDGSASYTVTQLGDAFKCTTAALEAKTVGMTSLTLPDTITKFTGTAQFYACKGLTSIHLPSALTGDGTGTGYLTTSFRYCNNLASVEIPSGITKLYGTFRNSAVRTVTLKSTSQADFFGSSGTVDARAWTDGTTGITIRYPSTGTAPTRTGTSFTATVQQYTVAGATFTSGDFTYTVNAGSSTVTLTSIAAASLSGAVTVPSTVTYSATTYTVTQLGDAFKNQGAKTSGITSITLPDTITKFTGTAQFYGCSGLTSIHLPSALTGDNTGTGFLTSTFMYCSSLASVEIPSGITKFYGTFRNSAVRTVTLTSTSQADFYAGSGTTAARAWTDGITGIKIYYPYGGTAPTRITGSFTATAETYGGSAPSAFEYGDFAYSVVTDTTDIKVTGFAAGADPTGAKTIPATVTYDDVEYTVITVSGSAFQNQTGITSITLPNTVTTIGNSAFKGCTGLTSFNMPDSVTRIGSNVFMDCSNLASVHLSSNLERDTNGNRQLIGTFKNCTALTTVRVPAGMDTLANTFNGSGVTNIILMRVGSTQFPGSTYVPVDDFSTVKVYVIEGGAVGGTSASSIVASNKFVHDGQMYYKATGDDTATAMGPLPDVTLTGAVTIPSKIGNYTINRINDQAFATYLNQHCEYITSMTVPDTVTAIGINVFYGESALESITLSKNLTGTLHGTFYGCTSLTSITIPEGIDTLHMTFNGCSALTTVKLPSTITTIRKRAFYGCSSLAGLAIPDTVTSVTDYGDTTGTVFPNTGFLLTVMNPSTAYDYARSYSIPYVVAGYFIMDGTAITGTNFRISGNFEIPNTVTEIRTNAFAGQDGLAVLTVPNSVTTIAADAFDGATSEDFAVLLKSTSPVYSTIKGRTTSMIVEDATTGIQYKRAKNASSFTAYGVADGSSVSGALNISTYDGTNITAVGERAFENQTGITSLTIGNTVTSLGDYAFAGCTGLVSADLTDNITGEMIGTFSGCTALTNADIPSGVTLLKETYVGTAIKKAVIPSGVESLLDDTFASCNNLKTVVIPASVTDIAGWVGFKNETREDAEYVAPASGKTWTNNPLRNANNADLAVVAPQGSAGERFAYASGIKYIDAANGSVYVSIPKFNADAKTLSLSARSLGTDDEFTVFAAMYDGDELVRLEKADVTAENSVVNISSTLTSYEDGMNIRVFAWDGTTMIPVHDPIDVSEPNPLKILVLGNSISLHGSSSGVGWFAPDGQGMAATSLDKDFAHVTLSKAQQENPNVEMKITSGWSLEANFDQWETLIPSEYQTSVDYGADIIIVEIGENINNNENEGSLGGNFDNPNLFTQTDCENIVNAFRKNDSVPVILLTSMMSNKTWVVNSKGNAASDNDGWYYVNFSNTADYPTPFAEGKNKCYYLTDNQIEEGIENGTFHDGVAIGSGVYVHPGNNGMRAMANAIWMYLEKIINDLSY